MSRQQQKRKSEQPDSYCEVVDDLAFAASFAIVTIPDVPEPSNLVQVKREADEIPVGDGTSDESSDEEDEVESRKEIDEDSGDESDIDLSQQLAQMENDDAPKAKTSRIVVPKTQNEIDLYNCPISDLDKKLDLDLGISDVLLFHSNDFGILNAKVSAERIRLAGNIKFHLESERTIVVESNPTSGVASSPHQFGGFSNPLLLDEGSLLLLRLTQGEEVSSKLIGDTIFEANEECVIPLGKILEVFGPVSKPLYTVRLTTFCEKKATNDKDKEKGVKSENNEGEVNDENQCDASKGGNESNPNIQDPWLKNGLLTEWIKSSPRLEVYYSEDQVKMIDTQSIVRNSRKACDASNIYDEEVTDTKEMYFSDDEEERMAKRGKKKNNQRNNSDIGNFRQRKGAFPKQRQPSQCQSHTNRHFPHLAGAQVPPSYQYQQQCSGYVQHPYSVPNAPPIYSIHQAPPLQNGIYFNSMRPSPPAGTNTIPPPPPPPPPPPRQQLHNGNMVQQHQMNTIDYPAPHYHHQHQHQRQPPYQQQPYQQVQYQQHQEPDQGNSGADQSNNDTVYYNYSG